VYQEEEVVEGVVEDGMWERGPLDVDTEAWLAEEADEGWMDGAAGLLGDEDEEAAREELWEERQARRGGNRRAQKA
jgi:hypothetical protein